MLVPALNQAQTTPQTTIFLADPQLGVVGVYQSGGNTLYFEVRAPDGSTQLSARLLDASGRNIAMSGHSMDYLWITNADFNAAAATQSLSLAAALPNALANALNRNVFPNEYTALSNLAVAAAPAVSGTRVAGATPAVVDSATANLLPSFSSNAVTAAASYDANAAAALTSTRDVSGNLNTTFGTTVMQTLVESFPNETSEDGTLGVIETSAQLVASDGTPLIQQVGGDRIPDGWIDPMSLPVPTTLPANPMQAAVEVGNSIRGAALMTRYTSIATAGETGALGQVAAALRDNGLLPQPQSLAHASPAFSASAATSCTKTWGLSYVGLWAKSLAIVVQHSGTWVYHWYWNGRQWVPHYGILFCNHGTCPYSSPMTLRCHYYSPATCGYYRNPPVHVVPQGEPGPGQFHSCLTGYGLSSFFNHNCNDDSWTQIRAIKGEAQSDQNFRCHDWKPDPWAPGCNE